MLYRVIPEATFKRRRDHLRADESERTERLARVIATAEYVWDDDDDARRFLTLATEATTATMVAESNDVVPDPAD